MITVNDRDEFLEQLSYSIPLICDGVEIGVLHGDFSRKILDVIKPRQLVLIDPYAKNEVLYGEALDFSPTAYSTEDQYQALIKRFEPEILSGQVIVSRKFSYDVVSYFEDESLDFVYIDADHRYPAVQKDLNDWMPKVKKNGVVAGHDYTQFDNFGVVPAVDEFCKENNFEIILFNPNGGDWALKRIK